MLLFSRRCRDILKTRRGGRRVALVSQNRPSHDEVVAEPVFHLTGGARNHVVPFADFLDQRPNIPRFPEITFVADTFENTQRPGVIQQTEDAKMAAQKVLHSTAFRVAGIRGFTERRPAPAGDIRANLLSPTKRLWIIDFDVIWVFAKPEVGSFTTVAGSRFKGDEVGRGDVVVVRFTFSQLFDVLPRLNQQPTVWNVPTAALEIALGAGQFDEIARLLEWQVERPAA